MASFVLSSEDRDVISIEISPSSEEILKLLSDVRGCNVVTSGNAIKAHISLPTRCDLSALIAHLGRLPASEAAEVKEAPQQVQDQPMLAPYEFRGEIQLCSVNSSSSVLALCVTPGSHDVVLFLDNSEIQVWSSSTWQCVRQIQVPKPQLPEGHWYHVYSIFALSDAELLISDGGDVRIVDLQSGQIKGTLSNTACAQDFMYLPDGRLVVAIDGRQRAVQLWRSNGTAWQLEDTLNCQGSEVRRVVLYKDRYLLVQGTGIEYESWDDSNSLQVWDLHQSPPKFCPMASSKQANPRVGVRAHCVTVLPAAFSLNGQDSFLAFFEMCASGESSMMLHSYSSLGDQSNQRGDPEAEPPKKKKGKGKGKGKGKAPANETVRDWEIDESSYPADMVLLPDGTLLGFFQGPIKRMALLDEGLEDLWTAEVGDGIDDCDGARLFSVIPPSVNRPLQVILQLNHGFAVLK
eukprot:TRINITY_DN1658_c0_g1_i1.p1 TRINITY_DN1658_c0_g1~~TRINITY_DN1658_c0_g1_i1.p1  ORF type:complete len:462 (-),score=93.08 TRINITY_DN1658_c0_g1_i1:257-1642(-)